MAIQKFLSFSNLLPHPYVGSEAVTNESTLNGGGRGDDDVTEVLNVRMGKQSHSGLGRRRRFGDVLALVRCVFSSPKPRNDDFQSNRKKKTGPRPRPRDRRGRTAVFPPRDAATRVGQQSVPNAVRPLGCAATSRGRVR
jgi:hypothetical protein